MVGECPFSGLAGPSIRRGAATGICGGVRTATRICWVDGRQFIAFQPPDTPLHHRHRRGTRLRSLPPALPLPCTCQPPPVHRQRPSADVEKTIANREEPAHCRRGGIRHGTLFVTSRCAQSGLPHGSRRTPRVHSQREGKGEATQRERNNLLSCFSRGRARAAMHPYLGAWHGGTGQAGSGVAIPAAVHATVVCFHPPSRGDLCSVPSSSPQRHSRARTPLPHPPPPCPAIGWRRHPPSLLPLPPRPKKYTRSPAASVAQPGLPDSVKQFQSDCIQYPFNVYCTCNV